ncbi:nicotinamide riboside transporter PnuC [uncultured Clostridium sp.]|uniref:nicotinamide riboside transporter PnuC n=1 Tax=uncultured Clostridium sp. TaxID=59620 RepID=UPI002606161F|nr:nicotinamide riboside transporter PnuC [uncultured Clostridium sp.]
MEFFKGFSPFQKIFFVVFMISSILTFFVPAFLHNGDLKTVFTVTGFIGLTATISGVITSIYQAKASLTVYFWWILNTIAMTVISFIGGLYGEAFKNLFILIPLEIYGFYMWKHSAEKSEDGVVEGRTFTKAQWVKTIIIMLTAWLIYGIILKNVPSIMMNLFGMSIKPDPSYIMDALSSVITTYALYLTSRRYVEQWYFWILSNIGFVVFVETMVKQGFTINNLSGAMTWLQYGVSSFYGFYLWRKMYKAKHKGVDIEGNVIAA